MSDFQNNLLAEQQERQLIPVLPLRDVVVYPHMVIPLFVGREKSILALEAAMADNKKILLLAQKNAEVDDPGQQDLYQIGTLSTILQMLKLPDGTIKVLVEGGYRASIEEIDEDGSFVQVGVEEIASEDVPEDESETLLRSTIAHFEKYVNPVSYTHLTLPTIYSV